MRYISGKGVCEAKAEAEARFLRRVAKSGRSLAYQLRKARAVHRLVFVATDEQASLLELVTGRVSTAAAPRKQSRPPPAATSARPIGGAPTTGWDANLASDASAGDVIFPGTMAAPTGSSLIMPGWC